MLLDQYLGCDADEAVIGLMAKNIAAGESIKMYVYGQDYCAAGVLESLIIALMFKLFWGSAIYLKLTAISLFSIFACLTIYFLNKYFNHKIALIFFLIFWLAPESIKISFSIRGYLPINILTILIFLFFFNIIKKYYSKQIISNLQLTFLFFFIGFGIWLFELTIIFFLAVLIFLFLIFKYKFFLEKSKFIILGFLGGYLPAIIYNLQTNFSNWRAIISQSTNNEQLNFSFKKILDVFIAAYSPDFIDDYRYINQTTNKFFLYFMATLLIISFFIILINKIKHFKKNYNNRKKEKKELTEVFSDFIIFYLILWFCFYIFFLRALIATPRYLWLIFPFLYFVIILALEKIKVLEKIKYYILSVVFIFHFSFNYWFIPIKPSGINCLNSVGVAVNIDYPNLKKVIEYLLSQNKSIIYSNYFLAYPLILHSAEKILALPIDLEDTRYIKYKLQNQKMIDISQIKTIVLFSNDPLIKKIGTRYNQKILIENIIILSIL